MQKNTPQLKQLFTLFAMAVLDFLLAKPAGTLKGPCVASIIIGRLRNRRQQIKGNKTKVCL